MRPQSSPDLLGRAFTAGPAGGAPGTRLVGDIIYLRTGEGWLYLATVIDLATQMVVGWQLADHMRTTLVRTSVGRTGVCWDNAVAESFFSALKNEMFHHQHFQNRAQARFAVADYIEVLSRPPTAALQPRLPNPGRGAHRVPNRSKSCMINNRESAQDS